MHWTPAFRCILLATAAITALLPGSAWAQVSPAPEQPAANAEQPAMAGTESSGGVLAPGDIIVTARRRNETSIAIPVAVTAVAGVELQRRGINNVDALARTVPTLITSEATSSPQGGIVAIRGLSGVDANPLGDQAVSFNIDGVQVARSSVRRLSQMDVAQIEVLKGPQALFFGKNSPGGIISIRSADPGNEFRAQFSSGYEFKADETRNEGFISTPVTDNTRYPDCGLLRLHEGLCPQYCTVNGCRGVCAIRSAGTKRDRICCPRYPEVGAKRQLQCAAKAVLQRYKIGWVYRQSSALGMSAWSTAS